MAIKVTKDNTDALLKAIRALTRDEILVGIPDANAERTPDPSEPKPTINNAALGYIQETGSPARNIPPRPFLVPGVKSAQSAITEQMKKAGEAALSGNAGEIERYQIATGLIAQSAVKNTIVAGEGFAALSERTLAQRKARGRKGTSPLIDTGQLLNSITFVKRQKGS